MEDSAKKEQNIELNSNVERAVVQCDALLTEISEIKAEILNKNIALTLQNFFEFIVKLMELVETNKKLTGEQKRMVVIKVVNECVEESELIKLGKELTENLVSVVLPKTIDLVIASSKGLNNINKKMADIVKKEKNCLVKLIKKMCCCCCRK